MQAVLPQDTLCVVTLPEYRGEAKQRGGSAEDQVRLPKAACGVSRIRKHVTLVM